MKTLPQLISVIWLTLSWAKNVREDAKNEKIGYGTSFAMNTVVTVLIVITLWYGGWWEALSQ